MVLGVGVVIGVLTLTFFPKQQTAQAVLCNSCNPHVPEPGPARPWEVDIPVSTYSQVNTRHGNVFTAIPVVSWSGRGPDMNMMLYHNSANVAATNTFATATGFSLGPGWSISYSDHLVFNDPSTITAVADDGTKDVFTRNGTSWVPPHGVHDRLNQDTVNSNLWHLTHKNQSYHEFELLVGATVARLNRVFDATNNALMLTYVGGVLDHVTDASNRSLVFNMDPVNLPGLLNGIQDPTEGTNEPSGSTLALRNWAFSYDAGRLEHIHDPMCNENAFVYYTSGRLAWISDKYNPSGDPPDWYGYGYESGGRLNYVLDPVGVLTQGFSYACQVCPYGSGQWLRRDLYTTYTDRRGNSWQYKFGDDMYTLLPTAYLHEITSPENGKRAFGYNEDRNLLYFCEIPAGVYNCWNSTYDSNGNRLTRTDPLNNVQSWTYGVVNNVTSSTDAAENVTQFKYETTVPTLLTKIIECPVTVTNPGVNQCPASSDPPTTTMAYYLGATDNGRGQVKEVIDPNGVWTGFEYDQWGQRKKYKEGQVTPTATPVYFQDMTTDSGGRTVKSNSSCGGGGLARFNQANQPTSTECILVAQGQGSGGPASPSSPLYPLVPCPDTSPSPPEVKGELTFADYSPKGETLKASFSMQASDGSFTRTHFADYDGLGRQIDATTSSNEYGGAGQILRGFAYGHDWANGTNTRTGPDNVQTFVQLDSANRVQFVRRGPAGSPLMSANYTYFDNDLMKSVTYGNGTSTLYAYDAARRVTQIKHKGTTAPPNDVILQLDYAYYVNDLPLTITESGASGSAMTTFAYDRLRRLTGEERTGVNAYDRDYFYDKGGNRTAKFDYLPNEALDFTDLVYTYDNSNPSGYGSFNNRLMKTEKYGTSGGGKAVDIHDVVLLHGLRERGKGRDLGRAAEWRTAEFGDECPCWTCSGRIPLSPSGRGLG